MSSDRAFATLAAGVAAVLASSAARAEPAAPPSARSGVVLGADIGAARPGGDTAGLFGPGLGHAFALGFRRGAWGFEIRVNETYELRISEAEGDGVRGRLSFTTAFVRFALPLDLPFAVTVLGGAARGESPMLGDRAGRVDAIPQRGAGAAVGAGVLLPVRGLFLNFDVRAYAMRWDDPGTQVYLAPGGVVTAVPAVDAGIPITASLGFRLPL